MKSIYEELSLDKETAREDIKREFLLFCKLNHPDKGGNADEFAKKKEMFETLLDDAKRKRYDETGEWKEVNEEGEIIAHVIMLVDAIVEHAPSSVDKFIDINESSMLTSIKDHIAELETKLEKHRRFQERLIFKKPNKIIEHHIGIKIDMCNKAIAASKLQIGRTKKVYKYFREYMEVTDNETAFDNVSDLNDMLSRFNSNVKRGSGSSFQFGEF